VEAGSVAGSIVANGFLWNNTPSKTAAGGQYTADAEL
jgi:hypothetical protein